MKITNVNIKLTAKEGNNVKALASVTIDYCFVIKKIRIIQNGSKTLVAMPSYKDVTGKYIDIAHPIKQETRGYFNDTVLKTFHEIVLKLLKENIKISDKYYIGYSDNNIHKITLYRIGNDEEIRGEELNTFILEDYLTETLKEMEVEINKYISELK